jgi:two-component system sensor histidine kinase DegS
MIVRTKKAKLAGKKNNQELGGQDSLQLQVKEFYKKILIAQEEEKRRISRDLHDETGQIVIGFGAALNVIERALNEGDIKKALMVIDENRKLIQQIANEMKSMVLNLRPPALDLLGLSAVLREFFSQCTHSNATKIEFNENLKGIKINEDVEITLYRIIQEATFNALKHSEAQAIKVDLIRKNNELQLLIEDDGRGFDIQKKNAELDQGKMGLRGIGERVDILNGKLSIESNPGKGTKLIVTLPLD